MLNVVSGNEVMFEEILILSFILLSSFQSQQFLQPEQPDVIEANLVLQI